MRPDRLELEGFTTFRDPTIVDFEGADLFALTGATGAGKSSLIDAMCFALYGIVPRYDDRRLVAPVISQGRLEARVRLDFLVGPERYTAVRVVRATATGATTKEARLERRLSDGEVEVLAGTADELTAEVTSLLGLTFEHFTTCVVLPQGDFAQFLHAKPKDRQKLLVELLDLGLYDRMRALAKGREAWADSEGRRVADQIAEARGLADPQRIDALAQRSSRLTALIERVDADHDRHHELERTAEVEGAAALTDASRLELLAGLEVPAGVADLAAALARAEAELADARAADDAAVAALDEAEKALAALVPRSEILRTRAAHDELAAAVRQQARGASALASSGTSLAEAHQGVAMAEAARVTAEAALDAARRQELVADLSAGLSPGDPCPVCGGDVHELHVGEPGAVAAARDHLDGCRADERRARATLTDAEKEHARIEEKLAQFDATVARLADELAGAPEPDALAAAEAELDAAESRVAEAKRAAKAGRDRRRSAEQAERDARRAEGEGRSRFDTARDRVAPLAPPAPARHDLAADWHELVGWADDLRPRLEASRAAHEAAAADARAAAEALVADVVAACAEVGITMTGAPVRDVLVDARADVDAELERRRSAAAALAGLSEREAALAEAKDLAAAMARHLASNGFEKWVLDAALRHLVAGATGVLHALSGGTYSLTLDPKTSNFFVVDHANADTVRSARTLSGGETFLASLALALSLADEVAQLAAGGAARLDAMFLDEGFGTLDADTLDTVAGALEDLGAQGRTVGLVTHVGELAERLPVRFVVTKTPSGSTVERIDR
jgi:exonuclease SbcC